MAHPNEENAFADSFGMNLDLLVAQFYATVEQEDILDLVFPKSGNHLLTLFEGLDLSIVAGSIDAGESAPRYELFTSYFRIYD